MTTNKTVFFMIGVLLIVLGFSMLIPYTIQLAYNENSHSFISSAFVNRSFKIGLLSIITSAIQILGYGYGYLKSSTILIFNKKNIEKVFSEVFFSK